MNALPTPIGPCLPVVFDVAEKTEDRVHKLHADDGRKRALRREGKSLRSLSRNEGRLSLEVAPLRCVPD